jgi:hypothetical protein
MMKPAAFGLAAGLALGLSSACPADDLTADRRLTETGVAFELKGSYSNVTLTVSGPDDFHASAFSRARPVAVPLLVRQDGVIARAYCAVLAVVRYLPTFNCFSENA